MLFDGATGAVVPPSKEFNVEDHIMKDSKGNYHLTAKGLGTSLAGGRTTPPALSGEPKEVYRGPGATPSTTDWEPVGPADYQILRKLGYRV